MNKPLFMGGIKDLLGFHFWLDNEKRGALESLLANQRQIPKDRQSIIRDLAFEVAGLHKSDLKKIVNNKVKP